MSDKSKDIEEILQDEIPEAPPESIGRMVTAISWIFDEFDRTGKAVEWHPSLPFYEALH